MPSSRFALHGKRPSLIHGLCAISASNSRFMRLSQAPLDTCPDSPLLARLSIHGLHFTVYAPLIVFAIITWLYATSLRVSELIKIKLTDLGIHLDTKESSNIFIVSGKGGRDRVCQ